MFIVALTVILGIIAVVGTLGVMVAGSDGEISGKTALIVLFTVWTLFALSFSLMKVQDHKAARKAYWEQKAR